MSAQAHSQLVAVTEEEEEEEEQGRGVGQSCHWPSIALQLLEWYVSKTTMDGSVCKVPRSAIQMCRPKECGGVAWRGEVITIERSMSVI